jgi:hypothetical protein
MELLREKIVKVRKEHSCFSCSDKINKNKKALSMTIVDDGIYNLYECMKCIIYKITNCMKCTNMECFCENDGTYDEGYIEQCKINKSKD